MEDVLWCHHVTGNEIQRTYMGHYQFIFVFYNVFLCKYQTYTKSTENNMGLHTPTSHFNKYPLVDNLVSSMNHSLSIARYLFYIKSQILYHFII